MPIYLPPPSVERGGTRIAIGSLCGDQCALRPRSWQALWIAKTDTRRASYGPFGPCGRKGQCGDCPVMAARTETPITHLGRWLSRTRIPVRVTPSRGSVWLMASKDKGLDSYGYEYGWDELPRLAGWRVDTSFRDEHGEGFWLVREEG